MKRFQLTICALLSIPVLHAQTTRNVLVEHFTNTKCTICASRNPGFYSNLRNFPQVYHIAFHPSAPYAACLLSQHNVTENDWRTNFYGVYGGTPRLVIQGNALPPTDNYNDPLIFNGQLGQTSPVALKVFHQINDSFRAVVRIRTAQAGAPAKAQLFLFVVEDTLFYSSPNGEVAHYDVFRKSVYSTQAQSIMLPAQVNDSMEIRIQIPLHNVWEKPRLYLMAVLQDSATHEVLQVASSKGQTDTPTGTGSKPVALNQWRLYPNPVSGYLNIEKLSAENIPAALTLRNANGQPCFSTVLSGSGTSNVLLTDLPPGLYTYELATPGKPAARGKLIIVR